jgi:hypothetical protein
LWLPILTPTSELLFDTRFTQVQSFLEWIAYYNCVHNQADIIYINMDETAIERQQAKRKGNWRKLPSEQLQPDRPDFRERINSHDTRSFMTLVAFICSDGALQPHMPQILMPKPRLYTAADLPRLKALKTPLHYISSKKGWVSDETIANILAKLKDALHKHCPKKIPVLILDSAPCHISNKCLLALRKLRLNFVLVPGSMTGLLQPLDTHVFRHLKACLHKHQLQMRLTHGDNLPKDHWLTTAEDSIREILVSKTWHHTFAANTPSITHHAGHVLRDSAPPVPPHSTSSFLRALQRPKAQRLCYQAALATSSSVATCQDVGRCTQSTCNNSTTSSGSSC